MHNYKDVGILIELKQLKEASKLAIVWTRSEGKKAFIVNGANKILSRKLAVLDTANLFTFTAAKSKTDIDLITEASLIDDFQHLKKDLGPMALLYYVLEVISDFLISDPTSLQFFDKIVAIISEISAATSSSYISLALIQYLILLEFGYSPLLDSCSVCYEELRINEMRIPNRNKEPGLICFRHLSGNYQQDILISDRILKILKFLKVANINTVNELTLTKQEAYQIFNIQNTWIESVLDKEIQASTLIKQWMK